MEVNGGRGRWLVPGLLITVQMEVGRVKGCSKGLYHGRDGDGGG